jgi:hypothetical protein
VLLEVDGQRVSVESEFQPAFVESRRESLSTLLAPSR